MVPVIFGYGIRVGHCVDLLWKMTGRLSNSMRISRCRKAAAAGSTCLPAARHTTRPVPSKAKNCIGYRLW